MNSIIGFETLTELFTLSGTLFPDTNYPILNLIDHDQKKVARAFNTTPTQAQIVATCATTQTAGVFALPNNTITATGEIRLRLYSDEAMILTPILDTGFVSVFTSDMIFKNDWIYCDGNNYNIKAVKIDIDDPDNVDGFIDFGYLEIATGIETGFNFKPGSSRGFQHNTTFSRAPGGKKLFNVYDPNRILSLTFDADDDELMTFYWQLIKTNGIHQPFIIIPFPEEDNLTKNAMLCRMTKTNITAQFVDVQRNEITLEFEEVTD